MNQQATTSSSIGAPLPLAPHSFQPLSLASLSQHLHEEASRPPLTASAQTQHPVLQALLHHIEPVDFRAAVPLADGRESLKQKHYLVTVVRTVLDLAKAHGHDLRQRHQTVYVYTGTHWEQLAADELRLFLREAAERMGVASIDARYHLFTKHLLDQFLSDSYRPLPTPTTDTVKVNLRNGTLVVNAQGQSLQDFDPEDFLTYQLPYAYDPAATAPLFQRFLDRVLPDASCQRILAEYLGYVFVRGRTLKLEKVLLLYGSGANGKSVFFEIMQALLGAENLCSYSLESLTTGPAYARANLGGKLVNYISELSGKYDANVFKQLASGEPVEARLPYGQPFLLEDYAKFIANCNELPQDVEHTNAYFRRFLIVPFSVTIPEAERNPQLAATITATELPGILNWVLAGLQRLLSQGKFSPCEPAQELLDTYQKESDSVRQFLEEEGYQADPEHFITHKEFFAGYRLYCSEFGYKPVSYKNFRKRVEQAGIAAHRKASGWGFRAVKTGRWTEK
jgi:putative DNA primase/helicase